MKTIRSKLVLILSFLILITFSVTGYVLVDRKTKEMTGDIYRNALNFSKLTSGKIVDMYRLYYVSEGFVYFTREMSSIFSLNPDITSASLLSYDGKLFYDSDKEQKEQYKGDVRMVQDKTILSLVQDVKPAIVTQEGRVLYVIDDGTGGMKFVDKNEKPVDALKDSERIMAIMYPHDNTYRVLYYVSYDHLNERIHDMLVSMILLLLISSVAVIVVTSMLATRIVQPLRVLMKGATEIGQGNFNVMVDIQTKDELKTLGDTFNTMAKDLSKSTEVLLEKERMGKELEIARDIQMQLMPKTRTIEGLDVAAGIEPALEVGGDCFDFICLPDGKWLMYIGDVTGHGVPSGLVVSMTNSLIYAYSKLFTDPLDIIVRANEILKAKTASDMFITMLMGVWDPVEGTFLYANAGHDPAYCFRSAGQILKKANKGGVALGLLPDISKVVKKEKMMLSKGDILFVYTDGLPESFRHADGDKREILGFPRFEEMMAIAAKCDTSQQIYDSLIMQIKEYSGVYPQFDDMTLVVMKKA